MRTLRTIAAVLLASMTVASAPAGAPPKGAPPAGKAATPASREVIAEGHGRTEDEARRDALRAAVSQVVGVLVIAEDQIKNDEVISSRILTYSDGYVERYEPVGKPTTSAGIVRAKIRAWVQIGKLKHDLTANAVPVRDIDARSMQGQSDTAADQSKSAAEMVEWLFQDYPAKLLAAEPLKPKRIDGDEAATTFEVPVRIRVDEAKWKAWVADAKKVLDKIATKKGTENWNVRMTGWMPLSGPRDAPATGSGGTAKGKKAPPSRTNQADETEQQKIAREARQTYWADRFVPEQERAGAMVSTGRDPSLGWARSMSFPERLAAATTGKRILIILDKLGGKVFWWQIPPEAWEALQTNWACPSMDVRLLTEDPSDTQLSPLRGWNEFVDADLPGRRPEKVIAAEGGIGGPLLRCSNGLEGVSSANWECGCTVSPDGRRVARGADSEGSEGDLARLLFPACSVSLQSSSGVQICLSPTAVFPFRFSVPKDLIPADGTLRVEAAIRLSVEREASAHEPDDGAATPTMRGKPAGPPAKTPDPSGPGR